jgi:hypothetical protein
VISGTRASLAAGVVSVSIAIGIGVPLGMLAGDDRHRHHRHADLRAPGARPGDRGEE